MMCKTNKFYAYKEYETMAGVLSLAEMAGLHQEMLMEIGNDGDALDLYEELVTAANRYSSFRAGWCVWSREEKMEKDSSRTDCHNSLIVKFDKLARYLKSQDKQAAWREVLGDEDENPNNRKRIGDFACYIVFVNCLCAR